MAGHEIEHAIKSETSGDLQKSYLTIVATARDVQVYFAQKIHDTMKGMGTKDDALIRYIVGRSEVSILIKSEKGCWG